MSEGGLTLEFEFRNQRFQDAAKGLIAFGDGMQKAWSELPAILKTQLRTYLEGVAEALAKRHGNSWPGGTTGNSLSRRSGALIAQIKGSVKVSGTTFQNVEGSIGASFIARTHEFGATITPKKAQYLTVPLPAALNSDGTPKKKSAREWGNTFIIKSRAGNLLIVQKIGNDIVPLYVLKKSVRIPPRLQMGATLKSGLPYFVDHAMETMLKTLQDKLGS